MAGSTYFESEANSSESTDEDRKNPVGRAASNS